MTSLFRLLTLLLAVLAFAPTLMGGEDSELLDATGKIVKDGSDSQILAHCKKLAGLNSEKAAKKLVEVATSIKSTTLQLDIVSLISGMERSIAHPQLLRIAKSLKDPSARERILDGLSKTCDVALMKAEGWKNSSSLVRAVAFAQMAEEPVSPTEEIKEAVSKETDPDALAGVALYMGRCAAKDIEGSFARERLAILVDSKDSFIQGLALKSIAQVKDKSMLDMIRSRYDHPDWRVRLEILEAVGNAWGKERDGTTFLLSCMKKEDGRLKVDCARILSRITGKDHGTDQAAWSAELAGGEGGDIRMGEEVKTVHPKYYGVEIASKRIIFIFDRTGSMINDPIAGVKKFQTAKDKLCDVLKELDKAAKAAKQYEKLEIGKRTHFTIIMFSDKCQWWKKEMVPATDENVKAACDWVQKLSAEGPTHADMPLKEALDFAKAGGGKKKSYDPKIEVDTIFFVTDGAPYKMEFGQGPGAEDMMRKYSEEILKMVETLNKDLKVVINAAGILGANATSPFLDRLAALTGGKVVYVPIQ
ncbi:MAG: hypothetical protein AB7F75_02570 [Planctomycetota bacterium]